MYHHTTEELAHTVEWCLSNGVSGLHASMMAEAAQRLRDLNAENERLTSILASNSPSVAVSEGDSQDLPPYRKELRIDVAIVSPLHYWTKQRFDIYELAMLRDEALPYRVRSMLEPIVLEVTEDLVRAALPDVVKVRDQWETIDVR